MYNLFKHGKAIARLGQYAIALLTPNSRLEAINTMRHPVEIRQYPVAETMHPWCWLEKWKLSIETAAALLGLERPHSFYRWHPQTKGEKRQPTTQIQVACALYDQIWQQTGCPYS